MPALIAASLLALTAAASEPVPAAAADLGKGMHIQVSRTIDASLEETWALFADDFAGISAWSAGVEASRELAAAELPEGFSADGDAPMLGRVVTVGGKEQSHVLVDFDSTGGTFTFRSSDLPPVMAYAQNAHTIEALPDGRTRVSVDVYLVPRGLGRLLSGKIAEKFTGYMDGYLSEAQAHLESAGG